MLIYIHSCADKERDIVLAVHEHIHTQSVKINLFAGNSHSCHLNKCVSSCLCALFSNRNIGLMANTGNINISGGSYLHRYPSGFLLFSGSCPTPLLIIQPKPLTFLINKHKSLSVCRRRSVLRRCHPILLLKKLDEIIDVQNAAFFRYGLDLLIRT